MPVIRILLITFVLLAADPALAMRCQNKLVKEGDHKAKVLKYCGEPTAVQRRTVYRSGVPSPRPRERIILGDAEVGFSREELLIHDRSLEEVLVEEWTYNLGPNRLMRIVRFENGVVVEVLRLSYGYNE